MRQFELWWANLPKPAGRRPVVLLSRDDAYTYLNKVIVAEVTTTIRDIPVEVLLGPREGLRSACVVNCDNLRTVPKQALSERISQLSARRSLDVKRAVGYALGWDELMDASE
jgi:mRNA interferase MazF